MKRNDLKMGVLYDMIKKLTESDVEYFDSKEYKADRMLEYLHDTLDDLQSKYDKAVESNGHIDDELYEFINALYKACQ